jgi:rsbT antagonist protein RsbS
MPVPIFKQGEVLIASVQTALTDKDLHMLQDDLSKQIGLSRASGVVIDVSALDVMDSFATRTMQGIARVAQMRGAAAVIVGIQPDVAFAMVELGLTMDHVSTALDIDEGLALLAKGVKKTHCHDA